MESADTISGAGGNDILAGAGGADTINGGEGADTLYSGVILPAYTEGNYMFDAVPPVLDTGTAVDTVNGDGGNDRIFIGYGDNANGGIGYDTLLISFLGSGGLDGRVGRRRCDVGRRRQR